MKKVFLVESHPLYGVWRNLIRQHTAKNTVCERWRDFNNFIDDIKEHAGEDYRFHRKYNDRPYGPDNYRWRFKYVSTAHSRENRKLYMRKWKAKRKLIEPDYEHDVGLKKQYGISAKQYAEILDQQGGACAICKNGEKSVAHTSNKIRRLMVDHCHATGKVRGILCSRCNRGLGFFQDSMENLNGAILYLCRG